MTRIMFVGKRKHLGDLNAYHAALHAQYPTVSEAGIQAMTKAELERVEPRNANLVQHLIGEDVIGAMVVPGESANANAWTCNEIEAWQWMTVTERKRIHATPMADRLELVDPVGLSRTYVWRESNGWIQDVTDADVAVIRRSGARHWFHNIDRYGEVDIETRAYDFPVTEQHAMTNWDDAKAFLKDREVKPAWPGLVLQ